MFGKLQAIDARRGVESWLSVGEVQMISVEFAREVEAGARNNCGAFALRVGAEDVQFRGAGLRRG